MAWFHTAPLDITDTPADFFHYAVISELHPRMIVLHATAGTNSLKWLTTTSVPPVSVHRLITRGGRIYKIVPDERVAYHVGHGTLLPGVGSTLMNGNRTTLGIELENLNDGKQEYPPAQLESCARQVVEWYGKYGYLPVVSHANLDASKSDPVGFPWGKLMVLVWNSVAGLVGSSSGA